MLDDSRLMIFDLSNTLLDGAGFNISLNDLTVSGLDSASYASLLEIVGAQTLKNDLIFEQFGVQMGVSIMTTDLEMNVTIHLEVEKLRAVVAVLVAIDKGILGGLAFGQMLESDRIYKCLLSSVNSISVPLLDVYRHRHRVKVKHYYLWNKY